MTDDILGIWEPQDLAKVQTALQETIVFGVLDRRGDTSPHQWACLDFEQFREIMLNAQPVHWYIAWSVKELIDLGFMLAHARYSQEFDPSALILSQSDLDNIKNYLSKTFNEIISVYISGDTRRAKCTWGDIDGYDEFINQLKIFSKPNCEVFVFPLTTIDKAEYLLVKTKDVPGY